ncbi:DUF1461 domain-containing protein [Candidatus Woesearchaeota archaeon]|nr:DUF1461 domain-containing protein [Candidatus Woesearchaeota archaeon]USN44795.1 MAG: DUF1461 domain-containing protein [Candidatus Woesearchaeota archaeon]
MIFRFQKQLLFVLGFFLLLWIALALMVYLPFWYSFNYSFQDTYSELGKEATKIYTSDLILYFLHFDSLDENAWSTKEKVHYADVRSLYDIAFVLALCSVVCLFVFWRRDFVLENLKYLPLVFLSLLLLLPVFSWFWIQVFHPLLFGHNESWIFGSDEISYFLFDLESGSFFLRSFLFLALFPAFLSWAWRKILLRT